ncbi:hepatoma-derived growth factor-related protein 2-like [Macadamia integrifolia]|uniref:hepatoma-derived growth factor-related protein 2-like n=1 Tax=Macadamia integrifolia TaxID=60698 RepID=UPI001C5313BF|nr:hepatoma-derived growth factor-related protein 2-like [Macadamia integrifolia]
MDLETENRIAVILMKQAEELRAQAEKDGVHVYLRQPQVRGRPNSRFLTATVRGVQQANRAAEMNEMWRVRQKELQLDDRLKERSRDKGTNRRHQDQDDTTGNRTCRETVRGAADVSTSSKRGFGDCDSSEEGGLRDEEVEEFLHSRVKRGRGAVGSRMDETGPYLPPSSLDSKDKLLVRPDVRVKEEWEQRVLGPEKPPSLKSRNSSEDEIDRNSSKVKKVDLVSSSKKWHSKQRTEETEVRRKKKDKKEKKLKHRHRS